MSLSEKELWEVISINPEKWKEDEYGYDIEGFWVVAIYQEYSIWYNDIEEGFNISEYNGVDKVLNYASEQDELQWTLGKLIKLI
ncbi:hypothetical protein HGP29_24485 [Flammeovirga sp. SR4]|uniref:Uncharacterized protein n=2 Tax=Flammeovirga agarivorans TaxID=2726742 RepID=A0A7X8XYV8_9BACT|nr:hypothetical protein [Flammeovirga agarivorans]